MIDKNKLKELVCQGDDLCGEMNCEECEHKGKPRCGLYLIVDYLLANNVTIQSNNQSEKVMNNRDEPFKDFIEKKLEQQRLEIAKQPVRFKVVSSSFLDGSINSPFITVYYDTVTKVMYQCIADRYGVSGINVMYNPDGSIMLYDNRG